jgi:FkbM family methyltransferase
MNDETDLFVTIPELYKTIRFPMLGLLYSFVVHARFFQIESEDALRVVDVGGCVGGYTMAGWLNLPNASFDIFEPWSACHPYLAHNLKGLAAVKLHKVAASDKHETLTLSFSPEFPLMGHSSVYGTGVQAEQVQAVPLDDVIQGRVDLMKIDVEGYEFKVLEGAQRILREFRPYLMVEIKKVHQARAGRTADDLVAYLIRKGYKLPQQLGNDYWFVRDDTWQPN